MKISQLDLMIQYNSIKKEINSAIKAVLESGIAINGNNVKRIEASIATYSGAKYGVGVANGSDALFIALKALGIKQGDGVMTTPFTFFSTAGSIARVGAIPIFVDIESDTYNIDPLKLRKYIDDNCRHFIKQIVDRKTDKPIKAIIPVHLYGQMCKIDEIMKIAKEYNLKVVEDCAQSIGAECKGKKSGSFGDLATFSFYPTKNLGTYGDGGMIITPSPEYAEYCWIFRSHGAEPKYYHKLVGINSRLDEIHAAILNIKFKYLEKWLADRFKIACRYQGLFGGWQLSNKIKLPWTNINYSHEKDYKKHTFNQYVIYAKDRDKLQGYLTKNGIGTNIYYPLCLHLQECFKYLGYKEGDFPIAEEASKHVLALPMYPELKEKEQKYIVGKINEFYQL